MKFIGSKYSGHPAVEPSSRYESAQQPIQSAQNYLGLLNAARSGQSQGQGLYSACLSNAAGSVPGVGGVCGAGAGLFGSLFGSPLG